MSEFDAGDMITRVTEILDRNEGKVLGTITLFWLDEGDDNISLDGLVMLKNSNLDTDIISRSFDATLVEIVNREKSRDD